MARTFTAPRGSGASPPRRSTTSSTASPAAAAAASDPGRGKQKKATVVEICDDSSPDGPGGGNSDGFDASQIPTVERIVYLPADPARRAEVMARESLTGLVFDNTSNGNNSTAGASTSSGAALPTTAAAFGSTSAASAATAATAATASAAAPAALSKKAHVAPKFTPKLPKQKKEKKKKKQKSTAEQRDNDVESAKMKAERKEAKKRKRSEEQEVGGRKPKSKAARKSSDPNGDVTPQKPTKPTTSTNEPLKSSSSSSNSSTRGKKKSSDRAPLEQPKKPRKFGKMCKEMARYLRAVESGRGWLAMDPELAEWAHEQRVEYVKFVQQQSRQEGISTGSTSSGKNKKRKRGKDQSKLNEEMIAKLRRIGFDPAEGGFGMSPPRQTVGRNTRISTDATDNSDSNKSKSSSNARDNVTSSGDKSTESDSASTGSSGPKRQLNIDPQTRSIVGAKSSTCSAASPANGERDREKDSRASKDDERAKRRKKAKSGISLLPPKSDVGGENNPIVLDDSDDNDNHSMGKVGAADKVENEPALRVYNDPGDVVCDIELADQDSDVDIHSEVLEDRGDEWCAFNYIPLVERIVTMDSKTNQPLPTEQHPPPRYSRQPIPISPPDEQSKPKLAESQKKKKKKSRVHRPQQPNQAQNPRVEAQKAQQKKGPPTVALPKLVERVRSTPDSQLEAGKVPCQPLSCPEQLVKPHQKSSTYTRNKPPTPKSASAATEATSEPPSSIEMERTSTAVNDEPSAKTHNVDEDANVPPAKARSTDEATNQEPSISQRTEARASSSNDLNTQNDSSDAGADGEDEVSKLKKMVNDLKTQLEEERKRREQAERRQGEDTTVVSGGEGETGGTKKTKAPSSEGKAEVEVIEIEDDDSDDEETEEEKNGASSGTASKPKAKAGSTAFFDSFCAGPIPFASSAAVPSSSSDSGSTNKQPAHPGAASVIGCRSRAQKQSETKICSVCKENHPEFRYSRAQWHQSNGYCHKCMVKEQNKLWEGTDYAWRAATQQPQGSQRRTSTTATTTEKKKPNKPQEDYLYSQREEQERLFREAANRLRQRQERARQVFFGGGQAYSGPIFHSPVSDVCRLPSDHWTWTDPFARLGLPRGSGIALVKKHFRKLALRYHPDKTMSPEASQAWHAVKESYEQLAPNP